jgi:hypothetical protein
MFEPNEKVDAEKIGPVQTARSSEADSPVSIDFQNPGTNDLVNPDFATQIRGVGTSTSPAVEKTARDRMIPGDQPGAGISIDARPHNRTPLGGMKDPADTKSSELSASVETNYKHPGHRHGDKPDPAWMWDIPGLVLPKGANVAASQTFETTALALEGAQKGAYYGSVSWG